MYSAYVINIITLGIPSRTLATIVSALGTTFCPPRLSLVTDKPPLPSLNPLSFLPPHTNRPQHLQCLPLTSNWLKPSKQLQCCRQAWQPCRIKLGFSPKASPNSNKLYCNPSHPSLLLFPHYTFLFPRRHHLPLATQAHKCKGNTCFLPPSGPKN